MFKDFDKRLKIEIKRSVDERLRVSAELSKNQLIVRVYLFFNLSMIKRLLFIQKDSTLNPHSMLHGELVIPPLG